MEKKAVWSEVAVANLLKSELARYPQDLPSTLVKDGIQLTADVIGYNVLVNSERTVKLNCDLNSAPALEIITFANPNAFHFVYSISLTTTTAGGSDGLAAPFVRGSDGYNYIVGPSEIVKDSASGVVVCGWTVNVLLPPNWRCGLVILEAQGVGADGDMQVLNVELK